MSKKLSTTLTRVLSAVVALAIVLGLYWYFKTNGLVIIILTGTLLAQDEFSRLVFERPQPSFSRILLVAGCFLITASGWMAPNSLIVPLGIVMVIFFSFFFVHYRKLEDLADIRDTVGVSALGLLYMGVLPSLIVGILEQPQGDSWFWTLLGIVFFGDTFAYFAGRALGRAKVLPSVSPNKTWAGAIGGLFGSVLAAVLAKLYFFTELPTLPMVVLALLTGASAQVGDFFESLLKRVADKKDSGNIMPGHGGILDRIDGVLFGAPFVYFASRFFLTFFGN